jgi:hypothetical protein
VTHMAYNVLGTPIKEVDWLLTTDNPTINQSAWEWIPTWFSKLGDNAFPRGLQ